VAAGPGKIHPHTGIRIHNPIQPGMSVLLYVHKKHSFVFLMLLLHASLWKDLFSQLFFFFLVNLFFSSGKFDGSPVEYNGDECQIIRDDDVLLAYTGVTMRLDNVEPIRDYVLIEIENDSDNDSDPSVTKSGVVIAAQVNKDDVPCEGRVAKIGPGRMAASGEFTPSPVQVGDMVKFKDYAGNDVIMEGKKYSVVKMVDILCTYDDDEVEQ
jgi:chaperonin GroES